MHNSVNRIQPLHTENGQLKKKQSNLIKKLSGISLLSSKPKDISSKNKKSTSDLSRSEGSLKKTEINTKILHHAAPQTLPSRFTSNFNFHEFFEENSCFHQKGKLQQNLPDLKNGIENLIKENEEKIYNLLSVEHKNMLILMRDKASHNTRLPDDYKNFILTLSIFDENQLNADANLLNKLTAKLFENFKFNEMSLKYHNKRDKFFDTLNNYIENYINREKKDLNNISQNLFRSKVFNEPFAQHISSLYSKNNNIYDVFQKAVDDELNRYNTYVEQFNEKKDWLTLVNFVKHAFLFREMLKGKGILNDGNNKNNVRESFSEKTARTKIEGHGNLSSFHNESGNIINGNSNTIINNYYSCSCMFDDLISTKNHSQNSKFSSSLREYNSSAVSKNIDTKIAQNNTQPLLTVVTPKHTSSENLIPAERKTAISEELILSGLKPAGSGEPVPPVLKQAGSEETIPLRFKTVLSEELASPKLKPALYENVSSPVPASQPVIRRKIPVPAHLVNAVRMNNPDRREIIDSTHTSAEAFMTQPQQAVRMQSPPRKVTLKDRVKELFNQENQTAMVSTK